MRIPVSLGGRLDRQSPVSSIQYSMSNVQCPISFAEVSPPAPDSIKILLGSPTSVIGGHPEPHRGNGSSATPLALKSWFLWPSYMINDLETLLKSFGSSDIATMDALLSLPLLGYFLAPSLTTYSTSLNVLFFYMVRIFPETFLSTRLTDHRHGAL